MKEKILRQIYKKLTDAFEERFLPAAEFNEAWETFYQFAIQEFLKVFDDYEAKRKVNDISLRTTTLEYFLSKQDHNYEERKQFDSQDQGGYIKSPSWAEVSELFKIKDTEKYNISVDNGEYNQSFKVFLERFLKNSDVLDDSRLMHLFFYYYQNWESKKFYDILQHTDPKTQIDLFLNQFRELHNKNEHKIILDRCQEYFKDFESFKIKNYVVNVGKRNHSSRDGWTNHYYEIINNSQEIEYTSSTKNEKGLQCDFAQVFLLDDKYLTKIFISPEDEETTKYSIHRDLEKITIRNGNEVFIAKHHGNETIIFDSRKDANDFQDKVMEVKEGRFRR